MTVSRRPRDTSQGFRPTVLIRILMLLLVREWEHVLILVEVGAGAHRLRLTEHARLHVDELGGELRMANVAALQIVTTTTSVFFIWNCS